MDEIKVISTSLLDESDRLLLEEAQSAIKSSIEMARDFCKTLIGFSSGSIPVYFAILKYLGTGQIDMNSFESRVSVLPPVLFLGATILSTATLVPRPYLVRPVVLLDDYRRIRSRTASSLRRGIIWAALVYLVGLAVAILEFIVSLF